IDSSADNIFIIDPKKMRFVDVNKSACEKQLGYAKDELLKMGPQDIMPHYTKEDLKKELNDILTNKDSKIIETVHLCKNGTEFYAEVLIKAFKDNQNFLVTAARDITERKHYENALQFQIRFEKMVSNISSYLLSLPSDRLDEGIDYALKLTGSFFQVDRSYVFQFTNNNQKINATHEWHREGIKPQKDRFQNISISELPWWEKQIKTSNYVYIPEVRNLPPEARIEKVNFTRQNIRSLLCIPIVKDSSSFGFLALVSISKKEWTNDQIMLLKVVAELISNAFAKQAKDKEIHYLIYHDALTGLHNRHYLEGVIKSIEERFPVSVMMIDLNGLKLINDTYGHSAGDEMLKQAANILTNSCREKDIVARWGGDEFVIILPEADADTALSIKKKIKQQCKDVYIRDIPISLAIGIA
ncbi:MAG: diguanylate cyclase, partial [Halanaerobium sp. MSAO_Bac5]